MCGGILGNKTCQQFLRIMNFFRTLKLSSGLLCSLAVTKLIMKMQSLDEGAAKQSCQKLLLVL